MSLKEIAKQSENQKTKKSEPSIKDDGFEKVMAISLVEGMNNYLYGAYVAYCRMNDEHALDGEAFMEEFKKIPSIKSKEKQINFLDSGEITIGKFLKWFLYES